MLFNLKVFFLSVLVISMIQAKADLTLIFTTLAQLNQKKAVSVEEWKGFVDQVDKACEKDKRVCEFYYMLESSLVLFEEDEYQDGGQCERAKSNVELNFSNQFPTQKKQVLAIVDKLCKTLK